MKFPSQLIILNWMFSVISCRGLRLQIEIISQNAADEVCVCACAWKVCTGKEIRKQKCLCEH